MKSRIQKKSQVIKVFKIFLTKQIRFKQHKKISLYKKYRMIKLKNKLIKFKNKSNKNPQRKLANKNSKKRNKKLKSDVV